ncbi:uncharacterized protein LOC116352191 isoform X2 [Contarinia nasturtii]|uniref:uncharacterized protein LOC116352191 isoform X2 n=1 Tax=Contarinia nasturtii TaxID=265458 RepID=UPI0012D47981|nr:uncharacterized protein LOC116352191 isoform X2 [Contarinia nasturtii]
MTTAVSMNRTEIPLKGVSGGDSIRSCQISMDDKPRYDIKSTIIRGTSNNVSGSATHQRNTMDQAITNRQPINTAGHSYSSDSDVAPNTMMMTTTAAATTTSSATAMRRLYFKSAKLSKTTQNSITTGQQAQHVPKIFDAFSNKVMVMGTSIASSNAETTINTSTESASTLATNVTGTDTSTCDSLDLGDTTGQVDPLLSSFDEPVPLTAIPANAMLNRLDEEDSSLIEEYETDVDTDGDAHHRRHQEDEDAKIPLLTSPEHQDEQQKQKYPHSSTAPHTAPLISKKHFPFDVPTSPRSVRTTEKSEALFTFEKRTDLTTDDIINGCSVGGSGGGGYENGCSKVIVDGNKVYYHGSSNYKGDNKISNGNGDARYRHDKLDKENACEITTKQQQPLRLKHMNDENYYDEQTYSSYSKYSRRDGPWKNRHGGSNKSNSSNKMGKLYSNDYTVAFSSSSNASNKKQYDDTMFPFDRATLAYDGGVGGSGDNNMEWTKRNLSSYANNYYDSPSPDYDYYEQFRSAPRKSTASNISSDGRLLKELTSLSRKQSMKLSKYDHPPSPSNTNTMITTNTNATTTTKNDQNHQYKNHISDSDAFSLTKPNAKTNSTSPDNTTIITTTTHNNATSISIVNQSSNCSANDRNPVSQFEQIASKFDKIPSKVPSHDPHEPPATSPVPDLRVDFFSEPMDNTQKRHSYVEITMKQITTSDISPSMSSTNISMVNNIGGNAAGINVTSNPMDETSTVTCTTQTPRATIVVQQPSLSLDNAVEVFLLKNEGEFVSVEQGQKLGSCTSMGDKKKKREENMRQLLDVTNTITSEEMRDFEMRYGSPHHMRSQSVKAPGRGSGRPNQLSLPQQRSRVASMPNTGVEEEYYRLRHFSITGKGVINRGDSLKSRRSRSNTSVASSNSSTEHLTANVSNPGNSARTSATCSLASSRESSTSNPGAGPYRVLMLGDTAVGKSSLVSQFMTSEYLHAYDTSIDDESGEKSVSVLLNGEESELTFIDHSTAEMSPENCLTSYEPHGYCVIYSSADRNSFVLAERVLQSLWTSENIAQRAVILVGNKADLARSRTVTSEEGKVMATAYDCKFIETSVGINHNVDELLVGLLTQIRLKLENPEKSRDLFRKRSCRKSKRRSCSPLGTACLSGNNATNPSTPISMGPNDMSDCPTPPSSAQNSPRKVRGTRTSASLKVKGLLGRVWARDSKSKSCENLHVL